MKYAVAALALVLTGCPDMDHHAHQWQLRNRGLTEDDLNGPPTSTEIRARIISDVRTNRNLASRASEGSRTMPPEIEMKGATAKYKPDDTALSVITLRSDPVDGAVPVSETAYYHDKKAMYFYHYVGGRENLDVWMGPFPTRLKPNPGDGHGHGH